MPFSAQIASDLMKLKPPGLTYAKYPLPLSGNVEIAAAIEQDLADAAYAAAISFAEALRGIKQDSTTWGIVKLYYASFYALRFLLLMDNIIPFHCGEFYFCDLMNGSVKRAGVSSHTWQWSSLWAYRRLTGWHYSEESTQAYDALRTARELVNYRAPFEDPLWPDLLSAASAYGVEKAFRTYRDDDNFFYTYLPNHFVLAYPTKLVTDCCVRFTSSGRSLPQNRIRHLARIWPLRDKPPLP